MNFWMADNKQSGPKENSIQNLHIMTYLFIRILSLRYSFGGLFCVTGEKDLVFGLLAQVSSTFFDNTDENGYHNQNDESSKKSDVHCLTWRGNEVVHEFCRWYDAN